MTEQLEQYIESKVNEHIAKLQKYYGTNADFQSRRGKYRARFIQLMIDATDEYLATESMYQASLTESGLSVIESL